MPRDKASSFHDSVIDNTDGGNDCCRAAYTGNIYNNYFTGLVNVVLSPTATNNLVPLFLFHDNTMTNIVTTFYPNNGNEPHGNCIHVFGNQISANELIYNNNINCDNPNAEPFEVEEDSATVYAFNNVWANLTQPNGLSMSSFTGTSHGGKYFVFQNTIEGGVNPSPADMCMKLWFDPTVTEQNNFCITSNGNFPTVTYSTGGSAFTGSFTSSPDGSVTCSRGAQTNWGGSQICAPIGNGDGTGNLNMAEKYPFAPMDATAAAKIGTATPSSAICSTVGGIYSPAGSACFNDSTLGVTYNTSNHTVSWPARQPLSRPVSGQWQIGAYELASGAPLPPTDLTAVVH